MRNIVKILLLFSGLLVAANLRNASPVPLENTISQLISNLTDESGLVNYFKELGLAKFCNFLLLKRPEEFNTFFDNDITQCLCTVIYNTTILLEPSTLNSSDVQAAQNKTSSYKYDDMKVYESWENVSKVSPSLKLLMNRLNTINKWKNACHSVDEVEIPYCKFLNLEILLLHNTMQKSKGPSKPNVVSVPVKKKEPDNISEKPKKIDNLPENKPLNKEDVDVAQKPKDEVKSNDEDLLDINDTPIQNPINESNLIIGENEPDAVPEKDDQIPNDSKLIPKTDDYLNAEDGMISQTGIKEAPLIPQKNTFAKHDFDNVEDSHFLFYFGIMTVLSMLFYLALYNKKKIIALLIEGRRSTNHRRRPNTASYSKVETDDGSTVF